ncbi:MAG: LysR family transcriptional regulator [Gammaproteobacteria bacterium]|nr:LysR family transcriptional regulator [Gammaproteobacteria bacterium]
MDIASIRAFLAVADHASFSQAAESLKITQPAVSKRIAALELDLSEKLFDRIGRKVILTEAGNTILPKCRSILEMVEDTELSLSNLSGQVNGCLRLGTSHHIGLHHLPPVISAFTQKYPDVELDLHFMDSETVCEKISRGDLELGIVTLPLVPPENISCKILWVDKLNFVVSKQHKLAELENISINDLMKFNAILPNKDTYTRGIIENAFKQQNLIIKTSLSTNYLETIKMMVTVGLGWSILPETMHQEDLRIINMPGIQLKRELGYVQHRQRTLSNAAIAMTSILTSLT